MATNPVNVPQLDQLEAMVNQVLEQTGRLFVQATKNNNPSSIANGARLKQILPRAMTGFNDALDELEQELTIARAVIRRDYAVFQAQQAKTNGGSTTINVDVPTDTTTNQVDVEMGEASSAAEAAAQTTKTPDATPPQAETSPGPENPVRRPSVLEIDTSASQPTQNIDQDPQATGSVSAMDFDSLFNDPNSNPDTSNNSITNSPSKQAEPATIGVSPQDNNQEFSFEAFNSQNLTNADNNNDNDGGDITSLLPGLESYANAGNEGDGGDGEPDFSILDDFTDPVVDKPNDTQPAGNIDGPLSTAVPGGDQMVGGTGGTDVAADGDGVQRDTTFDDLMNFGDFDMSALDGGDENFEDGGNRFDDSFFDI